MTICWPVTSCALLQSLNHSSVNQEPFKCDLTNWAVAGIAIFIVSCVWHASSQVFFFHKSHPIRTLAMKLYSKMVVIGGYLPPLSGIIKYLIVTEVFGSGGDIRSCQEQGFLQIVMGFDLQKPQVETGIANTTGAACWCSTHGEGHRLVRCNICILTLKGSWTFGHVGMGAAEIL